MKFPPFQLFYSRKWSCPLSCCAHRHVVLGPLFT